MIRRMLVGLAIIAGSFTVGSLATAGGWLRFASAVLVVLVLGPVLWHDLFVDSDDIRHRDDRLL